MEASNLTLRVDGSWVMVDGPAGQALGGRAARRDRPVAHSTQPCVHPLLAGNSPISAAAVLGRLTSWPGTLLVLSCSPLRGCAVRPAAFPAKISNRAIFGST